MVEIKTIENIEPKVVNLVCSLDEYLNSLYPSESNHLISLDEILSNEFIFLGAYENNMLVGCGGIKIVAGEYAEIKRMYVSPNHREKGIGKLVLSHLEKAASDSGVFCIRLETGIAQKEALGLYEQSGYKYIKPYGSYLADPLSLFMEKRLVKSLYLDSYC